MEANKPYLPPWVLELKGGRRDAKALRYLRKQPCHHQDYTTLPPIQAPGEGVSVVATWGEACLERQETEEQDKSDIRLVRGQGPNLRRGQLQAWEEAPAPESVEIPEGPHRPVAPWAEI